MRTVWCTLDLEATEEHFHAHAELTDYDVEPGDTVHVRGAPSRIPLGVRRTMQTHAVVAPAGRWHRTWVKLVGCLQFYELYDVGFEG
jgi:hypothetical protein